MASGSGGSVCRARGTGGFVPALEIEEKDNELFVKADLPGLMKET
jgi:HSP20 family molecular chaperone IbpA